MELPRVKDGATLFAASQATTIVKAWMTKESSIISEAARAEVNIS